MEEIDWPNTILCAMALLFAISTLAFFWSRSLAKFRTALGDLIALSLRLTTIAFLAIALFSFALIGWWKFTMWAYLSTADKLGGFIGCLFGFIGFSIYGAVFLFLLVAFSLGINNEEKTS